MKLPVKGSRCKRAVGRSVVVELVDEVEASEPSICDVTIATRRWIEILNLGGAHQLQVLLNGEGASEI